MITKTAIWLVGILLAGTGWAQTNLVPIVSVQVPEGSNAVLTVSNFVTIKTFILTNGLSQTYCQMYNGNPYFGFEGMNAYLNPDTQQANINCDRSKSDFNTLVFQDHKPIGYWDVIWHTNQNLLVVHKPWSKLSPDTLLKAVEDRFRQVLRQIERRKQSNEASDATSEPAPGAASSSHQR